MAYGSGGYGSGGYGSGGYGSGGYGSGGYGSGGTGGTSTGSGYGSGYGGDSGYGDGDNKPSKQLKRNKHRIEGIISGYEQISGDKGFIIAWFRSLFMGVPFTKSPVINIFQLVEDEFNSDGMCTEVHMVGEIVSGRLNNGERITVYGSKSASGCFNARKIVKTGSNMNVKLKNAIPAWVIRIITLLIIAAIIGVVSQFSSGSSVTNNTMQGENVVNTLENGTDTAENPAVGNAGGNGFNASLLKQILAGVIVILTFVFGGKIRNTTGLSMKVLWIIVAILVSLLVPEIGATIIFILAMFYLIKHIFLGR